MQQQNMLPSAKETEGVSPEAPLGPSSNPFFEKTNIIKQQNMLPPARETEGVSPEAPLGPSSTPFFVGGVLLFCPRNWLVCFALPYK